MKNKLYASGDEVRYKYYRHKISSLIRISKKYYSDYFEANMLNIKKTWTGINEVSFRRKKKLNSGIAIKVLIRYRFAVRKSSTLVLQFKRTLSVRIN